MVPCLASDVADHPLQYLEGNQVLLISDAVVGLLSHGPLALCALAIDRISPRGQPKAVLLVEREQVPVEEGVDLPASAAPTSK